MTDNSEQSQTHLASNPLNALRECAKDEDWAPWQRKAVLEGADEIERLTRESEENDDNARHNHQETMRLRAALERIKRIGPLGVDTYPECYRRMHAIAEEALSGEPGSAHETTTKSQAPIALLTVSQGGEVAGVTMYAPGLPPGDHDLYCEPEAVAPMMRDETFDVREANRKLCAAEGHVLSGPVRPCLRCHKWFDPHYGSPLKAKGESDG